MPKGSPGLPGGTVPGICTRPVSLVSLAPTLLELAGLPPVKVHDGQSLRPLLQNPSREWPRPALTFLDAPGSYGLSTEHWRYIRYADGNEVVMLDGDLFLKSLKETEKNFNINFFVNA